MSTYFVYILRCADGAYYVGSTSDLASRVATHNAGRGPAFTACRLPVELAYSETFTTMAEARQREIQLKKWSRAKKHALIAGDAGALHHLSLPRPESRNRIKGYLLDSTRRYALGVSSESKGLGSASTACWAKR